MVAPHKMRIGHFAQTPERGCGRYYLAEEFLRTTGHEWTEEFLRTTGLGDAFLYVDDLAISVEYDPWVSCREASREHRSRGIKRARACREASKEHRSGPRQLEVDQEQLHFLVVVGRAEALSQTRHLRHRERPSLLLPVPSLQSGGRGAVRVRGATIINK